MDCRSFLQNTIFGTRMRRAERMLDFMNMSDIEDDLPPLPEETKPPPNEEVKSAAQPSQEEAQVVPAEKNIPSESRKEDTSSDIEIIHVKLASSKKKKEVKKTKGDAKDRSKSTRSPTAGKPKKDQSDRSRKRARSTSPCKSLNGKDGDRSRSRSSSPKDDGAQQQISTDGHGRSKMYYRITAPSNGLGIFGMSTYTDEVGLRNLFEPYGAIESIHIARNHLTQRSRGFAFVYFKRTEDATKAIEGANGKEIDGQRVRIDYSISKFESAMNR